MAEHDPIDKGKVVEVVSDHLDHLDEWYGHDAEIGHVLVVARVTDAGGARYTDVVISPGTTKDEALEALRRAHDMHNRPAARAGGRSGPKAHPLAEEGVRWVRSDQGQGASLAPLLEWAGPRTT